MMIQFKIYALSLIILPFLLIGCSRDEIQAENSLEGDWDVVAITSYYGDFSETSFNATETIPESGQLGSFNFAADSVDYTFTRNDTLFTGSMAWDLTFEKVNAGFTRANQFTLSIGEEYLFDVSFEDETKNSEKEATSLQLTDKREGDYEVFIKMSLEKR
ncbi:MAG: hypothetical protein AB8H47_14525 [Bacteroidia bacterium]